MSRVLKYTFIGPENEIEFNPSLKLSSNPTMTLKYLSFPNYIYNINDDNNSISVTYGGNTYERSILPGSYSSFDKLSEKINEAFYPELPPNWINVASNTRSYKIGIQLLEGVTLDLMEMKSFFGFESNVLIGATETIQVVENDAFVDKTVNVIHEAENFPDLSNGLDNVYVHCNRIESQYNDSDVSTIMEIVPINVAAGQLASYTREYLTQIKNKMTSSSISSMKFSLTNKNGVLLGMPNGLRDSTTIIIEIN